MMVFSTPRASRSVLLGVLRMQLPNPKKPSLQLGHQPHRRTRRTINEPHGQRRRGAGIEHPILHLCVRIRIGHFRCSGPGPKQAPLLRDLAPHRIRASLSRPLLHGFAGDDQRGSDGARDCAAPRRFWPSRRFRWVQFWSAQDTVEAELNGQKS